MRRGIRMPKPAKIAKREVYNAIWKSGSDEKRLKNGRI